MQAITWLICVAQVVFWPTHSNKMWILSYIFIWIKTRPPNTTMCPCTPTHHGIPHWKGVLHCHDKFPSIVIPTQEANKDTTNTCQTISFNVYKNVPYCTMYGRFPYQELKVCYMCSTMHSTEMTEKLYTRKDLVLLETLIKEFHEKFYIPGIKKMAFNFPSVRILGTHHCDKEFCEAFKRRG